MLKKGFLCMYDLFLFFIALAAAPKFLYQMIAHKKYRNNLRQRLGIGFPIIEKNGRPVIWIHAVSMGEAKAVAVLVKQLKEKWKNPLIIFSTITETGLKEGKKNIPEADHHVFLPFDFSWIIKPIIKQVRPDLIVLCETDFWYNFLESCHAVGAKIALVNGKISHRSLNRFKQFNKLSTKLFNLIDLYCVQSTHYQKRFEELGIPSSKLLITGNIKFDSLYPRLTLQELTEWKEKLGIKPDDHVIVAGSTHDPEEKWILDACQIIWKKDPRLKLLIVPRHPERFHEVARLLDKTGIPFSKFSSEQPLEAPVLLVDAMGVLRQCYQLATLAIVAGSFTPKVGGHNIVEPCWYGVPVLFGPYLHSQPELFELVQKYHAGRTVTVETLANSISELLFDPTERKALGEAGSQLVHDLKGATEKTYHAISGLMGMSL
jgi:3-deoxy-D-manno-octulosonic-acid transferase